MPKTFLDPIRSALELIERGEALAAHTLLAQSYQADPDQVELGRIANLIEPCQMLGEARRALARALDRRFVDGRDYQCNPPHDAELGRLFWRTVFRATPAKWIVEGCNDWQTFRGRLGKWVATKFAEA
jgi:hypothetical protein